MLTQLGELIALLHKEDPNEQSEYLEQHVHHLMLQIHATSKEPVPIRAGLLIYFTWLILPKSLCQQTQDKMGLLIIPTCLGLLFKRIREQGL